jgi:hypothetical protein
MLKGSRRLVAIRPRLGERFLSGLIVWRGDEDIWKR